MEVEAAKIIWNRSVDSGLHYTTMLRDGDSKAFDAVKNSDVYCGKVVEKKDCINHVAKRLTTALMKLVDSNKKAGRSLGGIGKLTKNLIKTLHSYYRNAIKKNIGNLDEMKRSIMATPSLVKTMICAQRMAGVG